MPFQSLNKKKEYDSSDIASVYFNLKSLCENINWCIAHENYDLFYRYLYSYSKFMYENFELICLNIISFQDVMLFDFMETSNINYFINKRCFEEEKKEV